MSHHDRPYETFLWVELIGFDNELPDFGVDAYLDNCGFTPDVVSLFVYNPELIHTHDGTIDGRLLPFDCCSYGGHPSNYERDRQDWTQEQLRGLIQRLQSHGVAVFVCVFDSFRSDPWVGGHPEVLNVTSDGVRAGSVSLFAHLADGTLYEDFYARQLAAVLRDYGLDGYHQGDGYSHPRFPLYTADYSADLTAQFEAHSGLSLPEETGAECGDEPETVRSRAAWIWRHARAQWIAFNTDRMVQFCEKVFAAVHGQGKRVILNSALTRDPFQAIYRHGVDYQRIAAAGADGFFVETVAPGVIIGGESGHEANPHHDFQAMLLLIAAAVPRHKLYCLQNAHDVNEQWDVLLHGPTLLEREIYCETSLFHREADGGLRRCVSGPLVCLSDGIRHHEWEWLRSWWDLGYGTQPEGIVGATVVWSDQAHAGQLADYLQTWRFSTHKLLYELMSHGAPLHSVVRVQDIAGARGPLLVPNPHLLPRAELESILAHSDGPVILIGGLPNWLPEPAVGFSDCHAPDALACAVYGDVPPFEVDISDEPEEIPAEPLDIPDPPFYFRELYFRKVSESFLGACSKLLCREAEAPAINQRGDVVTVRALRMGPGRLRLLVGNDSHYYAITELDLGRPVKSARVATGFPGTTPPVADTRICGLRIPRHGMVVLDVEMEQ